MSNPEVSIIIPVYNAGALIGRCLDSVFSQLGEYSVEVIVVDDGSTDNSVRLVEERKEQDRIRLYRQTNAGPSKARNKGIEAANGKYLAFLDADDYWLPEFLDKTIPFMREHPECVAVSVAQRHKTLDGESEVPRNWSSLASIEGIVIDDFFQFWGENKHICTGSIVIQSEIAKKTGGMREDLRSCEDLEFWALVASCGKMGYIPQILFVSDGKHIISTQGWSKYATRFKETVSFDVWLSRLKAKLTSKELNAASPLFDSVVLGITRSFICAGKFDEALKNLKYYSKNGKPHYILTIASKGKYVWTTFCFLYRSYRYLKIKTS